MKKFISILTAVGIVSVLLPCYVSAAESGTCGENLTWTLDDNGTLTISGTGAMEDYAVEAYLEDKADSIKSVIIEDGITHIGEGAFQSCSNLTSAAIPDSVTHIGDSAFAETAIRSITIPESVKTIGDGAFGICEYLEEINIPETTQIGYGVFWASKYFYDMSNAENGQIYFRDHLIRTDTKLSGECVVKYGTKVIEGKSIYWCQNLTSVILPDTVEFIGSRAFTKSIGIKNITIPDSVTYISDNAFHGCEGLEIIYIPASVEYIGRDAFRNCCSLKDVYFEGTSKQWQEITDGENIFENTHKALKVHYNSPPQQNPYTAETALKELLPDEVTAAKTDIGTTLSLTTDSAKLIATHYKDGRLINVDSIIPANGIAEIDIALDTDDVKIWSYDDGFEVVYNLDADYLYTILENMV